MLASVTYWRKAFAEDFAIVHDVSANFLSPSRLNFQTNPSVFWP